ncbi:Ku protein [Aquabacter spiritensis]|uniref:Non-homologous end joining protein Ku n=1 Tax=Aquabacter spiritensis TaxID=933073 RepID=A0A4R3M5F7_9HYPH|nr:Ku protein [Aquabacter spiritensis]TCT06677.1 DNA end-binding protein Ku [Aquabacter spiritensis]
MAPRATWKGFLKLADLSCAVSLHTAVSSSGRIAFRTIDRTTGHAVRRRFVDEETGDVVEREDQVKGYPTAAGDHVVIEPEEVAATVPEADKMLDVAGFLPCDAIDPVFFDQPYFIAPADPVSAKVFSVLQAGMTAKKAAAIAHAVLFRRARTVLLRPHGEGMIATTLHFDYEVRAEEEAFSDIADMKVEGEMLDLATHIIATKSGEVDPHEFEDRYEAALADLVRMKIAGKPIRAKKAPARTNVVNLMDALRRSAAGDPPEKSKKAPARKAASRTKAAAEKPSKTAAKSPARRKAG